MAHVQLASIILVPRGRRLFMLHASTLSPSYFLEVGGDHGRRCHLRTRLSDAMRAVTIVRLQRRLARVAPIIPVLAVRQIHFLQVE